jgi:hypothetical protein
VPDLIGLFCEPDSGDLLGAIWPLEQAQIDRGGVFRKEREVDTGAVPRRSLRIWLSWPHLHDVLPLLCFANLFSSIEDILNACHSLSSHQSSSRAWHVALTEPEIAHKKQNNDNDTNDSKDIHTILLVLLGTRKLCTQLGQAGLPAMVSPVERLCPTSSRHRATPLSEQV